MILDEATNALDRENEQMIRETLLALKGMGTVLLISHQASVIELANKFAGAFGIFVLYKSVRLLFHMFKAELNCHIGEYGERNPRHQGENMSDNFLGEIRLFPLPFTPRGWMPCEGQLLPIAQNQALFALLGTIYGGNGTVSFQLPDFRGRVPQGISAYPAGAQGGTESVALTANQMPAHTHQAAASGAAADVPQPRANSALATSAGASSNIYKTTSPGAPLASESMTTAGGSQPHENRQPSLALQFCIAIAGNFPPRQ